jgi:type IV pilus assembly protein PilX
MRSVREQYRRQCRMHSGLLPTLKRQRGLALLIALLALVAMMIAGIALTRSIDSATLVTGNLALRQSATVSADRGLELAIDYLRGQSAISLQADVPAEGYHAGIPSPDADFTGDATAVRTDDVDWGASGVKAVDEIDAAGNRVAYVIHRLCKSGTTTLDPAACATSQDRGPVEADNSVGGLLPSQLGRDPTLAGGITPYTRALYRITVRVAGPRSTYSYVQAIVAK